MLQLHQLDSTLSFPHPENAFNEPNGLLAFGGDLSVDRLLLAYSNGIFPWYSEDEPLLWWSPDPRGILELNGFYCSRSFKKFIRSTDLNVTVNNAFNEVIDACASVPRTDNGTWITDEMVVAYKTMHSHGHGHSIEVWQDDTLVGGLYGISVGKVFCGESMFHKATNASKLAFYSLVNFLKANNFDFIDCQMQNPHLKSMGVIEISRQSYLKRLASATCQKVSANIWRPGPLCIK